MSEKELFENDFRHSPEMVVICRRADGSVSVHLFGIDPGTARQLTGQAFARVKPDDVTHEPIRRP